MEKNFLNINISASYQKVGLANKKTKNVWLIFHGYGQLAEDFSSLFTPLISDKNLLLFPQGLSKFYLRGVDKKIGANWMTSHDREVDIQNYLEYLDQLYEREILPVRKNVRLNILGFSQGGHTATRWINHAGIRYDKLILWGSSLAHEINESDVYKNFRDATNIVVLGSQDRFISKEQFTVTKKRYTKIKYEYEFMQYEGGHDIEPDILTKLI